jgi:hypothetical protein
MDEGSRTDINSFCITFVFLLGLQVAFCRTYFNILCRMFKTVHFNLLHLLHADEKKRFLAFKLSSDF